MITIEAAAARVQGITVETLTVWVQQEWVRPRRQAGTIVFEEVDLARIRLIQDLRDQLALTEDAIPVILSLLDQLHAARAELRRLATPPS